MAKVALTISIRKKVTIAVVIIIIIIIIMTQNNCNIDLNINIVVIHCQCAISNTWHSEVEPSQIFPNSKKQVSEFEHFLKKWIGLKGWHSPSLHLSTRNRTDWHRCSIEDWLLRKRSSDMRTAGMAGVVRMGKRYLLKWIPSSRFFKPNNLCRAKKGSSFQNSTDSHIQNRPKSLCLRLPAGLLISSGTNGFRSFLSSKTSLEFTFKLYRTKMYSQIICRAS